MVICLVWMRRLAAGMGVGVRSMPTGSFGREGLMLQDPKPLMNLKEISLMTHPDTSMKMYDINLKKGRVSLKFRNKELSLSYEGH